MNSLAKKLLLGLMLVSFNAYAGVDKHYSKAGFFDIHVCNWPNQPLFFMALFVPFATSFGTIIGAVYGFTAATLIAYWDVFTGQPGLSFQWIILVSLLVHIGVGSLLSLLPTKATKPLGLIIYSGMAITVLVTIVCLLIKTTLAEP